MIYKPLEHFRAMKGPELETVVGTLKV